MVLFRGRLLHCVRSVTDAYAVLGLQSRAASCSSDDIKQAYLKLVKANHPDTTSSPQAAVRMKDITRAYHILVKEGGHAEQRRNPSPPNREKGQPVPEEPHEHPADYYPRGTPQRPKRGSTYRHEGRHETREQHPWERGEEMWKTHRTKTAAPPRPPPEEEARDRAERYRDQVKNDKFLLFSLLATVSLFLVWISWTAFMQIVSPAPERKWVPREAVGHGRYRQYVSVSEESSVSTAPVAARGPGYQHDAGNRDRGNGDQQARVSSYVRPYASRTKTEDLSSVADKDATVHSTEPFAPNAVGPPVIEMPTVTDPTDTDLAEEAPEVVTDQPLATSVEAIEGSSEP